MKLFIHYFKESLSFDYRSLALFRFLLGIVVMADVVYRLPDLNDFYTDLGILPRSIFLSDLALPWSFSLHLMNGSLGFIIFLFLIHFLAGLGLSLGYKTRLMTFLSWILTISVHNRNWLVNNGGHDILRAILFISIFLPLGEYFSLDALKFKRFFSVQTKTYFSSWTMTFLVQVFLIYFMSYILKDHPIWREKYTAVFFASRLDIFATPIGVYFRNFPSLQKLMTIYTIFLEWLGPLLLLISSFLFSRWWILRLIVVLSFFILHLGIILTMYIGIFPYLCLAFWMAFLPSQFWNWIKFPSFLSKLKCFSQENQPTEKSSFKPKLYFSIIFQSSGVFILTALLSWNLSTIKSLDFSWPMMDHVVKWLHLYQEWNMFAPFPKLDNTWVEVPATFSDETQMELITGDSNIYNFKGSKFPSSVQNEQWRKFYLNLTLDQKYLKYFASYLCRKWNQNDNLGINSKRLKELQINVYTQMNLLDGTTGPIQNKFSWLHWCYDKEATQDSIK